jgi:hypothetical protein
MASDSKSSVLSRTRRVLMSCSAVALVLLVIVRVTWVVSLFRTDTFGWAGFDDRSAQTWQNWGLSSFGGEFVVYRMESGTVRLDEAPHHLNGTDVPGMRPHVFHHGAAWRQKSSLHAFAYRDFPEGGPDPRMPGWRLRFVAFPHWFVAVVCAVAGWPAGTRRLKRYLINRRPVPGYCRHCGYDVRASGERCPECGTRVAPAVLKVAG